MKGWCSLMVNMKKVCAFVVMVVVVLLAVASFAQAVTTSSDTTPTIWKLRWVQINETRVEKKDGTILTARLTASQADEILTRTNQVARFLGDVSGGLISVDVEFLISTGTLVLSEDLGAYRWADLAKTIGYPSLHGEESYVFGGIREDEPDLFVTVAPCPKEWAKIAGWLGRTNHNAAYMPQTHCLVLENDWASKNVCQAYYRFLITIHELAHAFRFFASERWWQSLPAVHDSFKYADESELDFFWDWYKGVDQNLWTTPPHTRKFGGTMDRDENTEFGNEVYPSVIPSSVWSYLPPATENGAGDVNMPAEMPVSMYSESGSGCSAGWKFPMLICWLIICLALDQQKRRGNRKK